MHFCSKISEYAIRALLVLSREKGWRMHVKTICELDKLPVHFTRKALQTLTRYDLVDAIRGPKGGYTIKKAPEDIYLYDIINIFEPIKLQKQCLMGPHHCTLKKPCEFMSLWIKSENKLKEKLTKLSIADVTFKRFTI